MNKYMKEAIEIAKVGVKKGHGGPFGCVIVKDGVIISKAHNMVLKKKDPTAHAEVSAIRKACKKLKSHHLNGCELYCTGRPCPMCRSAIQWAKIETVYYGCDYNDAKEIGFDEESANSKDYKEIQIDREECLKLYKNINIEVY